VAFWDTLQAGYRHDSTFFGGHSRDDLQRDCALFSPPAEVKALRDSMEEDLPTLATAKRRRRVTNRRSGRAIDDMTGAALMMRGEGGAGRVWEDTVRREKPHVGELTVMVNTAIRGNQSQSDIVWRGAAALAVTDLLETLGYRVRLIMARRTHFANSQGIEATVVLKEAGEQLSESSMAVVCDAGLQRLSWFAYLLSGQTTINLATGGHGSSYSAQNVEADVIIPFEMSSEADARRFVQNTLDSMRTVEEED
jgi:hypothetical protein